MDRTMLSNVAQHLSPCNLRMAEAMLSPQLTTEILLSRWLTQPLIPISRLAQLTDQPDQPSSHSQMVHPQQFQVNCCKLIIKLLPIRFQLALRLPQLVEAQSLTALISQLQLS